MVEELALEACVVGAFLAHPRNGVPEHVLHPHGVDPRDVRLDVREAVLAFLPVAAERIAAVRVVRLPAVVHDDRPHAHLRGDLALALDLVLVHVLVEVVPRGVERGERGVRHVRRFPA